MVLGCNGALEIFSDVGPWSWWEREGRKKTEVAYTPKKGLMQRCQAVMAFRLRNKNFRV
jgi:hypothetical protein